MPYDDDVIEIVTPERVELNFPIAGLASRFMAVIIDLVFMLLAISFFTYLFIWIGSILGTDLYSLSWVIAAEVIVYSAIFFLYFILFEYKWNGQTPGKRALRIRVMRKGGLPVDFASSAIRNLMRPVDILLFSVAIGFLLLFMSKLSQRPGDYAAGTLVVRDRNITLKDLDIHLKEPAKTKALESTPLDHRFAKLDAVDFHLLDQFMVRRGDLDLSQRRQLAERIASSIRAKLRIRPEEFDSNEFLITTAYRALKEKQSNW